MASDEPQSSSESLLIVNTRTRGMEMTASTETGVEDLDNVLESVTTDQPKLSPAPPAETGTTDNTGNTNSSGPMHPMDGHPSPQKDDPPQQPQPLPPN